MNTKAEDKEASTPDYLQGRKKIRKIPPSPTSHSTRNRTQKPKARKNRAKAGDTTWGPNATTKRLGRTSRYERRNQTTLMAVVRFQYLRHDPPSPRRTRLFPANQRVHCALLQHVLRMTQRVDGKYTAQTIEMAEKVF